MYRRFLDIIPTDPVRIEKMFSETDPGLKARILAAYTGYPDRRAAVRIGGDTSFWEPSILVAQAHAATAPTFGYRYDFAPRLLNVTGFGATHATELLAVFGAGDDGARPGGPALGGRRGLREATAIMQSHWLHFARSGAPRVHLARLHGGAARDADRRHHRADRERPAGRPAAGVDRVPAPALRGRADYLSSLDSRRSASGLPPVWQVAQYCRDESAKDTSRTVSPQTGHGRPVRPCTRNPDFFSALSRAPPGRPSASTASVSVSRIAA